MNLFDKLPLDLFRLLDVRRQTTKEQLDGLVGRIFGAGKSKDWKNYCRGNKRQVELLFTAETA